MHDLGDMLVHAGFADPVMDMEHITLTYRRSRGAAARAEAARRDQRDARPPARPHGARAGCAANAARARSDAQDGRMPATFEVVYGHAWKGEPKRTAEGHPIVKVRGGRPRRRRPVSAASSSPAPTPASARRTSRARCCARCARSGVRAAGMKPIAAGIDAGATANADVDALAQCRRPRRCRCAIAILTRSRRRSRRTLPPATQACVIDLATIAAAYRALRGRADVDRRRGRGRRARARSGPASTCSTSRGACACRCSLVVGMRLGCLNHALLDGATRSPRAASPSQAGSRTASIPRMARADDNVAELACAASRPARRRCGVAGRAAVRGRRARCN